MFYKVYFDKPLITHILQQLGKYKNDDDKDGINYEC